MREHLNGIDYIEQHNTMAIAEMKAGFKAAQKRISVITDVDEFLVDTVGNHVKLISRAAKHFGFKGNLPTYEDIIANGGTAHYAKAFEMTPEAWEERMARVRSSRYSNRNAAVYHPEAHTIISGGEHHELIGILTAKPGTPRTLRTAQQDLFERLQIPQRPAMLKPDAVSIGQSSQWKVDVLAEIAAVDPSKALVLTDDSISTAKAIAAHNQKMGYMQLMQVLYPGPLTKGPLEKGIYTPRADEGIFVADWETMPEVFDIINQTWEHYQN